MPDTAVGAEAARVEEWLTLLGCPDCGGALRLQDASCLACRACAAQFPIQSGVPLLLREADRDCLDTYGRQYRAAREREGWTALARDQALALPVKTPPGASELYWSVRRTSYRRLMRVLAQEGPSPADGPAVDLGAGTGWFAYRLAQAGYRVLAVDASLDDAFGLGAAGPYLAASEGRLLLAQGNLEHPPLYRACWSLVVYNASLHYVSDLEATLARAARALVPGGRLIVLDTPVARHPVPGTGRGDRHLGRRELEAALAGAGFSARWLRLVRGPRWWAWRLKACLRGSAPFAFPTVIGERTRAGSQE